MKALNGTLLDWKFQKTGRYEVCFTFDSMTRWRKDMISSKFVEFGEQTSILFFLAWIPVFILKVE